MNLLGEKIHQPEAVAGEQHPLGGAVRGPLLRELTSTESYNLELSCEHGAAAAVFLPLLQTPGKENFRDCTSPLPRPDRVAGAVRRPRPRCRAAEAAPREIDRPDDLLFRPGAG